MLLNQNKNLLNNTFNKTNQISNPVGLSIRSIHQIIKGNFEVTIIINTFSISNSPSIDVCNIDVFKNDDKYKGYIFKNKINYYLDTEKVVVGLSSIGYKDSNYISLIHIRHDALNDELVSLPIEGYNSISNNPNSQYIRL